MSKSVQGSVNFHKEIEVGSDPENLKFVEAEIEKMREKLNFREDAYGNVMIATTEAVNNGIIHGNRMNPEKKVRISFEATGPYRILVVVEDEGSGFNPEALRDPTAPENIENPGGRGVFLMRHLCDEIRFLNDGRRVEMLFNI